MLNTSYTEQKLHARTRFAPCRTAPASRDVGCAYVASLISIVLNRMGAVTREKSVLAAYCVRSLVDTRSAKNVYSLHFQESTFKKNALKSIF